VLSLLQAISPLVAIGGIVVAVGVSVSRTKDIPLLWQRSDAHGERLAKLEAHIDEIRENVRHIRDRLDRGMQ